jgi:hypothetical protein
MMCWTLYWQVRRYNGRPAIKHFALDDDQRCRLLIHK